MIPLQQFYNNESQRKAVQAFMVETLRELAADYALEGKETSGFKEANECVEKMFDKLEDEYGIVKTPVVQNSR